MTDNVTDRAAQEAAATRQVQMMGLPDWLRWRVIVNPNRRSLGNIGITIEEDGSVVFRFAPHMDPRLVATLVQQARPRFLPKARSVSDKPRANSRRELVSGEEIRWLGTSYRMRLVDELPQPVAMVSPLGEVEPPDWQLLLRPSWFLHVRRAPDAVEPVIAWYRRNATVRGLSWLRELTHQLAPDLSAPTFRVVDGRRWPPARVARTLLGTTTAIEMHWAVFQLPPQLVELTLVHELGHVIHPDEMSTTRRGIQRAVHGPLWRRHMHRWKPDWQHLDHAHAEEWRTVWRGDTTP